MISEEEKTEVNPDEQEKTEENKSDKNEKDDFTILNSVGVVCW